MTWNFKLLIPKLITTVTQCLKENALSFVFLKFKMHLDCLTTLLRKSHNSQLIRPSSLGTNHLFFWGFRKRSHFLRKSSPTAAAAATAELTTLRTAAVKPLHFFEVSHPQLKHWNFKPRVWLAPWASQQSLSCLICNAWPEFGNP